MSIKTLPWVLLITETSSIPITCWHGHTLLLKVAIMYIFSLNQLTPQFQRLIGGVIIIVYFIFLSMLSHRLNLISIPFLV